MLPLSRMLAIAGLAFLLAVPTQAQSEPAHPDLSGTWDLDIAKSKFPKKFSPDAETVVITCGATSVEITVSARGMQDMETFIPDGKLRILNTGSGGPVKSRAQWKKSVLVTDMSGRHLPGGGILYDFLATKQRWSLSPDGHVLIRHMSDGNQTRVYNKQ
jgi:hypothetical protein